MKAFNECTDSMYASGRKRTALFATTILGSIPSHKHIPVAALPSSAWLCLKRWVWLWMGGPWKARLSKAGLRPEAVGTAIYGGSQIQCVSGSKVGRCT